MTREALTHPFPPLYDEKSEILILGSFPSLDSRKAMFYYGNPRNRFWPLLSQIFKAPIPQTISAKKELILAHRLALYDVIASCTIIGSADASVQDVVPFDLALIKAPLRRVILNGALAGRLYEKYLRCDPALPYVVLPSTSPANAQKSLSQLVDAYEPYLLFGETPVSLVK